MQKFITSMQIGDISIEADVKSVWFVKEAYRGLEIMQFSYDEIERIAKFIEKAKETKSCVTQ